MTDEVPFNIAWQLRSLFNEFVNVVFAKMALPGLVSFLEILYRLRFAHCKQQRHLTFE